MILEMMLTARLHSKAGMDRMEEICSNHFVSDGATLLDDNGIRIAENRERTWHGKNGELLSIDFVEPVVLRFAAPGVEMAETVGPLLGLRLVSGSIWDGEKAELVATFEPTSFSWNFGRKRPPAFLFTFEPGFEPEVARCKQQAAASTERGRAAHYKRGA
jgi:hypothetical protein